MSNLHPVLADITNPAIPNSIGNVTTAAGPAFSSLIRALIGFALVAGSIAFIFWFLTGALQWITSGGDKDRVQRARDRISNAVLGLIILFSIYAALWLISRFLGVNLLYFTLPSLT